MTSGFACQRDESGRQAARLSHGYYNKDATYPKEKGAPVKRALS
jgi:hypothetical protein